MLHRNGAPPPATRYVPYAECLEHSMFLTREQHAWITCYPVVPFLRNRPLLVTSPTKLKKQTSTKSKMFSVAHIQIWMGSDDGITSSMSQRLLRQIPLATDKHLSMHPPPSGELKNVETNPNSQAVIMTCLPLDLDGKSRLYQVALSANATSEGFYSLTDFCRTLAIQTQTLSSVLTLPRLCIKNKSVLITGKSLLTPSSRGIEP